MGPTSHLSRRGRAVLAVAVGATCLLVRAGVIPGTGEGGPAAAIPAAALPVGATAGEAPATTVAATTVAPTTVPPTTVPPTTVPPTTVPLPPPLVVPTAPEQWFAPGGRNEGTEAIVNYLTNLAMTDNAPLYLSDTWGRTTGPSTSDHSIKRTDSWAGDVAVRGIQSPTPQTYEAARRISSALGVPDWPGGNLVKTINGYRIQVLWLVAGHFNHVHVGVRKVG